MYVPSDVFAVEFTHLDFYGEKSSVLNDRWWKIIIEAREELKRDRLSYLVNEIYEYQKEVEQQLKILENKSFVLFKKWRIQKLKNDIASYKNINFELLYKFI